MKNILRICLILPLFFGLTLSAFAKNESITVISDVHLSSDKQNNTLTPSIKKLKEAVKQANEDTSDCVVFLGDNVQGGSKYDIAMFAKVIKKLNKPYYVIPGNRDINRGKNVNRKEFYRIVNKFSSNKIKKIPSYAKQNDYIFIFMSGVNETIPSYRGYYKEDELIFLNETLTKFKDKKAVIFQHFPLILPKEDPNRKTVKPENYLEVLNKHKNVLAVVSGHFHLENISEEDNIKHISVGALTNNEYEQIKIFKNKDNTYSITTKILNIE